MADERSEEMLFAITDKSLRDLDPKKLRKRLYALDTLEVQFKHKLKELKRIENLILAEVVVRGFVMDEFIAMKI